MTTPALVSKLLTLKNGVILAGGDSTSMNCWSISNNDDGRSLSKLKEFPISVAERSRNNIRGIQPLMQRSFCVSGEKGFIHTFGIDDQNQLVGASLKGHTGNVWGLDYSSHMNVIVSGSVDKTVKLWSGVGDGHFFGKSHKQTDKEEKQHRYLHSFSDHVEDVYSVKFCGSQLIASADYNGDIALHDIEKLKLQRLMSKYHSMVRSSSITPHHLLTLS